MEVRGNIHGGRAVVENLLPSLLVLGLQKTFPLCWCWPSTPNPRSPLPRRRIRAGPGPGMPRRQPRDRRRLPLIFKDLLLRPSGSPWQLLGETLPLSALNPKP